MPSTACQVKFHTRWSLSKEYLLYSWHHESLKAHTFAHLPWLICSNNCVLLNSQCKSGTISLQTHVYCHVAWQEIPRQQKPWQDSNPSSGQTLWHSITQQWLKAHDLLSTGFTHKVVSLFQVINISAERCLHLHDGNNGAQFWRAKFAKVWSKQNSLPHRGLREVFSPLDSSQ